MEKTQSWYIVKRSDEHCDIISAEQITDENDPEIKERWGPFDSQGEALARRVGLIRAGKCQPV